MSRVSHLLTRPATLVLRTYADDDSGEGSYSEIESAANVYVEQIGPSESDEGSPASTVLLLVMENIPGANYLSAVRLDGETYELQGPPHRVWDPRSGTVDHMEAQLRWAG